MKKWYVSYETETEEGILIVSAKDKFEATEVVAKEVNGAKNVVCIGKAEQSLYGKEA